MNRNQIQLNEQATALFDSMQQILEDRNKPVIESYAQDFYTYDRRMIEQSFAPGGEYLWLLHPCGTHFGMIGVLPPETTFMHSAINAYEHNYAPNQMELYHIKVGESGTASIQKRSMEQGKALIATPRARFKSVGDGLYDHDARIATVSAKMALRKQQDRSYIAKIDTGGNELTRHQAIVAAMYAELSATKMSDLFVKCKDRLINEVSFDQMFPPLQIAPAEMGKYAPNQHERQRGLLMAKLHFRYAAMNAGKSTALLQVAHNYHEQGLKTLIMTAVIDDRYGSGRVTSRLGVSREAPCYDDKTDFMAIDLTSIRCVLIDEAQFCTPAQASQLHQIAALKNVPVICYGLRSDFKGNAFPGAAMLLTLADDIEEIKTLCPCGKKATMNARLDEDGNMLLAGPQVEIGGNSRYRSLCAKCFHTKTTHAESAQALATA